MTIREIVEKMEAHHAPLEAGRRTCDGIITGDPDKACTGVALTCCPTAAVIQKAADQGCNFIICHEPTFFGGWDETDWLQENQVYLAKKELLDRTGMVIYRNHDHLHGDTPDGIFTGLTRLLGWEEYAMASGYMPGACFQLPETTVGAVARHLAQVMHIDGMRIVGDPDMKISRAGLTFHFLGGDMDKASLDFIEKNDMQVIIPGETVDWTIVEYVQDAIALGKKRALLVPGHFNWEEPGMEYMAGWLPDVIGTEVPVTFIQSGNQYRWLDFQGK